jgi:propionyl-CoA synthetase
MEECLISHQAIAEAAVVGAIENLKGEVPVGFVVIKEGCDVEEEKLTKELVQLVRKDIGAVACLKRLFVVNKLPKTRSGKILRRVLKCMLDGKDFDTPVTIEDFSVLGIIHKQVLEALAGTERTIMFEEDQKEQKTGE